MPEKTRFRFAVFVFMAVLLWASHTGAVAYTCRSERLCQSRGMDALGDLSNVNLSASVAAAASDIFVCDRARFQRVRGRYRCQ